MRLQVRTCHLGRISVLGLCSSLRMEFAMHPPVRVLACAVNFRSGRARAALQSLVDVSLNVLLVAIVEIALATDADAVACLRLFSPSLASLQG